VWYIDEARASGIKEYKDISVAEKINCKLTGRFADVAYLLCGAYWIYETAVHDHIHMYTSVHSMVMSQETRNKCSVTS
jgi:hypothetical protein